MKGHLEELKLGGRPMTKLEKANNEIERLHSIIKEVREYVSTQQKIFEDYDIAMSNQHKNILEILDKDSDKE